MSDMSLMSAVDGRKLGFQLGIWATTTLEITGESDVREQRTAEETLSDAVVERAFGDSREAFTICHRGSSAN